MLKLAIAALVAVIASMQIASAQWAPHHPRAVSQPPSAVLPPPIKSLPRVSVSALIDGKTWPEAIAAVEARSEDYRKEAEAIAPRSTSFGTAHIGMYADNSICSVLGRLLGKAVLVRHLEEKSFTEAYYARNPGSDFAEATLFLDAWARAAKDHLKLDASRRIEVWNLDCVRKFGIPSYARIETPISNTFFDVVDKEVLHVLGDVEPGFARRLLAALDSHPEVHTVALGSAGGVVSEAIWAGQMIRSRRLNTTLWKGCYSACPLVFLGGVNRYIMKPLSELGFHQISVRGVAVALDDPVYNAIAAYAREMGVDSKALLLTIWKASPSGMHIPEYDQLCRSGIATFVQHACSTR